MSKSTLNFVIFCIEGLAEKTNTPAKHIYKILTEKTDILYSYIVPCFEILHTQSKEYILDDIINVLEKRGAFL